MTTEERLAKVEQELAETKVQAERVKRRTRWLLTGATLVLGVGLVAWVLGPDKTLAQATAGGVKEVHANRFVLEDENGEVRATLGMTQDGPVLYLLDENGKRRAALSMFKDGPVLVLADAAGKLRATLGILTGGPALALLDENGLPRVTLGIMGLGLTDENGKRRAALAVGKDSSGLILSDENGKTIWRAP